MRTRNDSLKLRSGTTAVEVREFNNQRSPCADFQKGIGVKASSSYPNVTQAASLPAVLLPPSSNHDHNWTVDLEAFPLPPFVIPERSHGLSPL